jgi:hypothetical protein
MKSIIEFINEAKFRIGHEIETKLIYLRNEDNNNYYDDVDNLLDDDDAWERALDSSDKFSFKAELKDESGNEGHIRCYWKNKYPNRHYGDPEWELTIDNDYLEEFDYLSASDLEKIIYQIGDEAGLNFEMGEKSITRACKDIL